MIRALAPLDDKIMMELQEWWDETAHNDLAKNIDKIREYGSTDLIIMGMAMEVPAFKRGEILVATGIQRAITFYLLGKIARAISAWDNGQIPSEDTLYDITFYSMMLRRVRETGRWP